VTARLDVLVTGYVTGGVAGTVSLVRDAGRIVVVDPGMVADRSVILEPLEALGVRPGDVTDVVISHHHPDHTWHIALFPSIRLHDYWATYRGDVWDSRPAEGVELTPSIRLLETPGHTREDITTLVETGDGRAALTHLWWNAEAAGDPRAWDPDLLHHHRARVVEVADLIVPGHGAPFAASEAPD
jgi:glyoxylase-like metal-dependent hydrolase (beta-lactamase superfamily II)